MGSATSVPPQRPSPGMHVFLLTASVAYAAAGFSLSVLSLILRTVVDETIIQQYIETPTDKHPSRRFSAPPHIGRKSKRHSVVSRHSNWSGNVSLPHVSSEGVSIFVSPPNIPPVIPKQEDLGYFPYIPPTDEMSDGLRPTDVKAMISRAKKSNGSLASSASTKPAETPGPERKRKLHPFIRAFTMDATNFPKLHYDCSDGCKSCPVHLVKGKKSRPSTAPTEADQDPPQPQTPKAAPDHQQRERKASTPRMRTQPYAAPYFTPIPDASAKIKSIHPTSKGISTPPDTITKGLRKLKANADAILAA